MKIKNSLYSLLLIVGMTLSIHAASVDNPLISTLNVDRFEIHNDPERSSLIEGRWRLGYDIDKLYLYHTIEASKEGIEAYQSRFLYARAISAFWDMQAGVSYDTQGEHAQTWAEISLMGLAPYYFETHLSLRLNSEGNVGLNLATEYELLLSQKLILSSSLEADFYTQEDSKMQISSGLSSLEAGLRLRYEIKREIAPYIGITWEKSMGEESQESPSDTTHLLLGIKFWF